MNCKCYRKRIREAALGTLEDSRLALFNAHLAECVTCRQAFEAEQRLLAAIDQGIVTRVQGAPSANFATGVRMRLDSLGARASLRSAQGGLCPPLTGSLERAGRPRSQAWWRPSVWSPALALAVLAAVLLTLWFVRRTPHPRAPERARSTAPITPAQEPQLPEQMASVIRPKAGSPMARRVRPTIALAHRPAEARSGASDQAPHLEVLVEPGQWPAIVAAYRAAQSGRVDPESLADKTAQDEPPISLKPVEIAPVTVAELYPESKTKTTER
jgi:hypothetical protein